MEIEKTLTVSAPREQVWALLLDPQVMGGAVPGMKSIDVISPTEYVAVMHQKIAFISAKFKLRTHITEQRAPEYLCAEGTGEDASVASSLKQRSEVFLTLTDPAGPELSQLQRLTVDAMCSNRDLPLHMPLGVGVSHFTADSGAPLERITCIAGPTAPRPALARDRTSWQLINHLALNYRSIVDDADGGGAAALRTLLALYQQAPGGTNETESIVRVASRPVVRRLPVSGPITFGRGLEIEVEIEERSLRDPKAFLLGAVLEQFFARYVSLNSFTETVVTTLERGEIMRWPTRLGSRHLL